MTILRAGQKLPFASVALTANESITRLVNTAIPWDAVTLDEYAMWDVGNKTRLTTPDWANHVQYGSNIEWAGNNTGYRWLRQRVNGANFEGRGSHKITLQFARLHTVNAWCAPRPAVGGTDYFETMVYTTSTAATLNVTAGSATWASLLILG